ncbi:hypothetical protein ACT7DN_30465 [Bacillus paranthracis]
MKTKKTKNNTATDELSGKENTLDIDQLKEFLLSEATHVQKRN